MIAPLLALAMTLGPRQNHAPIALVGGFTVWGREEAFGLKYWGGPGRDVQEDLKARGFDTVTAAPGPFSSNWDRAAEVFAQLRGGRVDYGKAHSERFGHARYGRTYPGLVPGWGGPGVPQLHLVGHSMGGQTIRALSHLLAEGSEEEREATPEGDLSPLFQGGHPWVLSLTSISSPHDGTTLTRKREGIAPTARRILALVSGVGSHSAVYDLKLDPWGLDRARGEAWADYRNRILESPLWQGTQDFSAWDLSLDGARDLNRWATLPRNVFAFSWSTAKTHANGQGFQVPSLRMNLLWHSGARFMGRPWGADGLDSSWFRNDGVVNTRSMAGPAGEGMEPFAGGPTRGRWNHMGVLEGWDHSEILGMGPEHGGEVLAFYRTWAQFLGSLDPSTPENRPFTP